MTTPVSNTKQAHSTWQTALLSLRSTHSHPPTHTHTHNICPWLPFLPPPPPSHTHTASLSVFISRPFPLIVLVQGTVFFDEVLVHLIIRDGVKGISVGLMHGGTRYSDTASGPIRVNVKTSLAGDGGRVHTNERRTKTRNKSKETKCHQRN